MTMPCGICGHPGQHAVVPGASLPETGTTAPLCTDQCARCRDQVREQQQDD
ncbi:hypothetical protein [Streptomyces sp. NPDC056165]|uniref:hypothetical protein n=1 Tax=Streptomyces sp. NPDC056165 TaxID=3345733 RepID=UPI0035E18817